MEVIKEESIEGSRFAVANNFSFLVFSDICFNLASSMQDVLTEDYLEATKVCMKPILNYLMTHQEAIFTPENRMSSVRSLWGLVKL